VALTEDPLTDPRAAAELERLSIPALAVADVLQRLGPAPDFHQGGRRPAADDVPEPGLDDDPEADARADAYLLSSTAPQSLPTRPRHTRPVGRADATEGTRRRRVAIGLIWLAGAAALVALFFVLGSFVGLGEGDGDGTDPTVVDRVVVGSDSDARATSTTSTTTAFAVTGLPVMDTTTTTAAARRRPAVAAVEPEEEPAADVVEEPVAEEPPADTTTTTETTTTTTTTVTEPEGGGGGGGAEDGGGAGAGG
jgi:hypothetical protein